MSTPSIKVHDSKQVHLSLAGRLIESGRDEAAFVTTEFTSEVLNTTRDAHGNLVVSRTNDESATIKIKLLQNSESHRLM